MHNRETNLDRLIDVVTYIELLIETSNRYQQRKVLFDSMDEHTLQYICNRILPVIENPGIGQREYHEQFTKLIENDGWTYGETEDIKNKRCPDLLPYDQITQEARERMAFRVAITVSIIDFYRSLRKNIESEIMDEMGHVITKRTTVTN